MPSRVGLICVPRSRRTSSTLGGDRHSTICGVQTDSGQEIGDATSGEGASRHSEENSGGWPIQGRRSGSCKLGRREEGKKKEEIDKIQRDLVKVLGDSWPGKESESTRAWGDLPRTKYSWKRRDSSAQNWRPTSEAEQVLAGGRENARNMDNCTVFKGREANIYRRKHW